MSENEVAESVEEPEQVVETVLWIEEQVADGKGVKYAVGTQLSDTDENGVVSPSGIEVLHIDELLGQDGEGGDFKLYAKPVDPNSPLAQQNLGLVLYFPRKKISKWAAVGPLDAMLKAREEAIQVQGEADEVEEEESDGSEEGHEGHEAGEHGTHLGDVDTQGSADAPAAAEQVGGTQPVGDGGAVDSGSVQPSSGG